MVDDNARSGQTEADVTVVMPAYNRADTIGRALDSILAQTVSPREVIVIDDASSDDTVAVARARGVRVVESAVNRGSGPARNEGIESATSAWVAFLDADDQWSPDHLATVMGHADGHVMVCAAGRASSGAVVGNPYDAPLELSERLVLETSELIVTSGCLVRTSVLLEAGSFRPLRRAQDLDLWLRVLRLGRGVSIPDLTVTYHEHAGQASVDRDLTIQCVTTIIDSCATEPWFRGPRDRDRAFARIRWDAMRAAQRDGDRRELVREGRWLALRPHAWPALVQLLRVRKVRRSRGRVPVAT